MMSFIFRRILLFSGLLFIFAACSGTPVHKINYSHSYKPEMVKRVAILHFNRADNANMNTGIIVDKLTAALVSAPSFKLVDRADIQKIYKEVGFQTAGEGAIDEKTKQVLKQLGADSIITGTAYSYVENRRSDGFILFSEVHLTAKLLKIDTGEVLWSAEILRNSKAKNVGQKKLIGGESEAVRASKLLDEIISDMGDSLCQKKSILDRLKI